MARPELLDRRSGWGGGKVNATTVLLEPLAPEETERLIDSLTQVDDGLRLRITGAAEGNPLFVEEMVAMLHESPDGDVAVPPTIQALLAARLDQLDPPDRDVLQCGSVEGRVFHRGAVQALAPDEPQVTTRLTALVRKELVRPDKPQLPDEDAFRFRHLLIRDAAYNALARRWSSWTRSWATTWSRRTGTAPSSERSTITQRSWVRLPRRGWPRQESALLRAETCPPPAGSSSGRRLCSNQRRKHAFACSLSLGMRFWRPVS